MVNTKSILKRTMTSFLQSPNRQHRLASTLIVLTFILLVTAFFPSLAGLGTIWQSEEYSHGFLIPLIAVFLGWHQLAEKQPKPMPSWWGLSLLLIAALL